MWDCSPAVPALHIRASQPYAVQRAGQVLQIATEVLQLGQGVLLLLSLEGVEPLLGEAVHHLGAAESKRA